MFLFVSLLCYLCLFVCVLMEVVSFFMPGNATLSPDDGANKATQKLFAMSGSSCLGRSLCHMAGTCGRECGCKRSLPSALSLSG